MSMRAMSLLACAALALGSLACGHDERQGGASTTAPDDDHRVVREVALFECEGLKVDAACGQCQFGLEGEGCALAVRVGKTAWFVDGTDIDDHGDAHADDGFCNRVRQAVVSGRAAEGRFVATSFELVPEDGED